MPRPDPTPHRRQTRARQFAAEDVVRNGEGVRHVIKVKVHQAPDFDTARHLGKAIVNAPLFKCAVAGNDPNVGRLVQAIGKHVGAQAAGLDLARLRLRMGGIEIFADGVFKWVTVCVCVRACMS